MGLTILWQIEDNEHDTTKPPADANATGYAVLVDDLEAIVDAQNAILVKSEAVGIGDTIAFCVLAASPGVSKLTVTDWGVSSFTPQTSNDLPTRCANVVPPDLVSPMPISSCELPDIARLGNIGKLRTGRPASRSTLSHKARRELQT